MSVPRALSCLRSTRSCLQQVYRIAVNSYAQPSASRLYSTAVRTDLSDDAPIAMSQNPYAKEKKKCLLCRTDVALDYKNARLLQQFVSTFSGRVYDRHITGLCDHQQKKLVETIAISRKAGYMPVLVKDPKYTRDPKLFDPLKPIRPHSFA